MADCRHIGRCCCCAWATCHHHPAARDGRREGDVQVCRSSRPDCASTVAMHRCRSEHRVEANRPDSPKGPRLCRSAVTLNRGSRWSPSRNRQALPHGNAHRLHRTPGDRARGIGSRSAIGRYRAPQGLTVVLGSWIPRALPRAVAATRQRFRAACPRRRASCRSPRPCHGFYAAPPGRQWPHPRRAAGSCARAAIRWRC